MKLRFTLSIIISILWVYKSYACAVVYFVDPQSGTIYVANNEDYWYDTDAYIQINAAKKHKYARLWYGWDDFAQGGINEAGLFFDGAVTPEQNVPEKSNKPKGNLGDEILANCRTVAQALDYLQLKKVALSNAHMMIGDSTGNAVVVEWINGKRVLNWIQENHLVMTNFLISDTTAGNYPCYRYESIEQKIKAQMQTNRKASFLEVGNFLNQSAQVPRKNEVGRTGGTLYSTFIDITNMEFILVYKLDNSKIKKLNLNNEFQAKKKRKIQLK